MSTFYIGYSLISLSIILIWIMFPKITFINLFNSCAYHFGKEDTDFLKKEKKIYDVLYFLKGSIVIVSPLIFHKIETILIFQSLNFNISGIIFIENIFCIYFINTSFFLVYFYFLKKKLK